MEQEGRHSRVIEWRIQNLSHWTPEVHGDCIQSPKNVLGYRDYIELYPKGIGRKGEHLVVRLYSFISTFSGELSFHSSDGSLLGSEQQWSLNDESARKLDDGEPFKVLPPGPKFEDVLSRIREDFITVTLRVNDFAKLPLNDSQTFLLNDAYSEKANLLSTINVAKIAVKINPSWIEKMDPDETKAVFSIAFSPDNLFDSMALKTCSKNNMVHVMIEPPSNSEPRYKKPTVIGYPFAVEMSVRLTGSDGTVDRCVKKEHVFYKEKDWTFPDPLQRKELIGKGISLVLCLKTRNLIHIPSFINRDTRCVSIEFINTPCFSEKARSTDPVETSDLPEDSVHVLSNETH